jgi:hypothetical protein
VGDGRPAAGAAVAEAPAVARDRAVGVARAAAVEGQRRGRRAGLVAPAFATGGRFVIVITAVSLAVAPSSSRTVSVTVYVPAFA